MVNERTISFAEGEEFNPDIAMNSEEDYREIVPSNSRASNC